jgi:hypothetical protein
MNNPEYTRLEDGRVAYQFDTDDENVPSLIFVASDIRVGQSSPKAYVKIGIPDDNEKAISTVHLDDDKAYSALSNRAALSLWKAKPADPRAIALREHMMRFCDGLYEFHLGSDNGEDVAGDENPSAPPWAVPGLVLKGSTTIAAGGAGSGKSTLFRMAAQSLRYGKTSVIPIKEEAMVIWVNGEEHPDEHTRQMGNINGALGLARTTDIYTVDARGMVMGDLAPRVRAAQRETGAEYIFIDSLSRLAGGEGLNKDSTANSMMDAFGDIPSSINWIAHTGHENILRMAGSKHFENAARVMTTIQSRITDDPQMHHPELRRGVRAKLYKGNGTAPVPPMHWTLEYHAQYGLVAASLSDADEWPTLRCDYSSGEPPKNCNRRTWEGVYRYGVRCSRHVREEEE